MSMPGSCDAPPVPVWSRPYAGAGPGAYFVGQHIYANSMTHALWRLDNDVLARKPTMTKPLFYAFLILGAALLVIGMWTVATAGPPLLGWVVLAGGLIMLCAPAVSWGSAAADKLEQ